MYYCTCILSQIHTRQSLKHVYMYMYIHGALTHKSQKLEMRLQRRRDRIGIIRRLAKPVLQALSLEVFVTTVTDLGIQLCVADGDVDETIAKLANHYSCPVLADDSDYQSPSWIHPTGHTHVYMYVHVHSMEI